MKSLLICIVFILSPALGCLVLADPPWDYRPSTTQTLTEVAVRLQHQNVLIASSTARGSGVLSRSADGKVYIWTVAHMIDDPNELLTITTFEGLVGVGKVVFYDDETDVALLSLGGISLPTTQSFVVWNVRPPALTSQVITVGNPYGQAASWSVFVGRVSFLDRDIGGLPFLQVDCGGIGGMSGGGVYNLSGQCLGLHSRGMGPTLEAAVPSATIQSVAAQNHALYAFDVTQ